MSLKNIKYGDVIENDKYSRKILGRVNDVIFISANDDFSICVSSAFSIHELEEQGYEIKKNNSCVDVDDSERNAPGE